MDNYSKLELTGLPNSFFELNRSKFFRLAKEKLINTNKIDEDSILALKGGVDIPKYDTDISYYYFYQEANFYYISGVREPGLDLIIDFKSNKVILFYNQPDESTKYWQTVLTKQDIYEKYSLEVIDKNEFNSWINIRDPKEIYSLTGINDTSKKGLHSFEFNFINEFSHLNLKIKENDIIYYVIKDCRKVKSNEEINLYHFISKATNEAHKEMIKALGSKHSKYKNTKSIDNYKSNIEYERDIENIFNNYLAENYYTRIWGYPCISGCGENSATLHYSNNNKKLIDGELLLIDMGMRFCNYVSDVTITLPISGKFSKEQKEIYNIVLNCNRKVMDLVKEGVTFSYLNKLSKLLIIEGLQELDFISKEKTASELFDLQIYKYFYPHSLGHYIGIEVHDVYYFDREKYFNIDSDVLLENNIITIEPGIYFRDFLLDKAFKNNDINYLLNTNKIKENFNFGGVRIEDNVIVKKDGYVNLNKDLPRTVEEIEKYMKLN